MGIFALVGCMLLAVPTPEVQAGVPVQDRNGNVIGELAFRLNTSGTGERFFGFNAKQTLVLSVVLDATGEETKLTLAHATQRNDLHETEPPYIQLESSTVTASWSGPVTALIVADFFPGLDLLWIHLPSGEGRLARHGQGGSQQNLSGSTDPAYDNEFLVFFVNGTGAAAFDLPEGSVFALDALAAFADEDDAALGFYIGPNVRIVKYQTDVPIGAPIPGGQGLRGRIDEVSGRLRFQR